MVAHLYKIPSGFANIADRIIIQAKARESYPGNWLHTTIPLPEGVRVIDDEYNQGAVILSSGEIIREAYTKSRERIDVDAFVQVVGIYDRHGVPVVKQEVRWK